MMHYLIVFHEPINECVPAGPESIADIPATNLQQPVSVDVHPLVSAGIPSNIPFLVSLVFDNCL